MKIYVSLFLVMIVISMAGCSKSSDSPVSNDTKGIISGIVTNSTTNQPIAGAKVKNIQLNLTTTTDNSGKYSFESVTPGTYSVYIYEPAYSGATYTNVAVTSGTTTTQNGSLKQIAWEENRTVENATIAIPATVNPTIKGVSLASGDLIGCFFASGTDSTKICSSFSSWKGTSSVAVTAWGDDVSTSTKKDGFKANEIIAWKVKRASDGKVFDATVTYSAGSGAFSNNGTSVIATMTVIAD